MYCRYFTPVNVLKQLKKLTLSNAKNGHFAIYLLLPTEVPVCLHLQLCLLQPFVDGTFYIDKFNRFNRKQNFGLVNY